MRRHARLPIVVLFCMLLFLPELRAQDPLQQLDAFLAKFQEFGLLNGTVLVARDGKVILEKGYGWADMELGVPLRGDSKILLASITKTFTAVTAMRLAEQGKLSLEAKVSDLLPWYRRDTGSRITVRHLLSHTSGIPDYLHIPGVGPEGFLRETVVAPVAIEEFAKKWCSGDLQSEPGSRYQYCNSGYFLLGAIIASVSGKPFPQAVAEQVLVPLGMKHTGDLAADPRAVIPGMARHYMKRGREYQTSGPWNYATALAAGSMYSTVGDMLLFDQGLYRDSFLSEKSRRLMFTAGLGGYGCGWEIRRSPLGPGKAERTVLTHEGFLYWVHTRFFRVPEERICVVILNNTGDAPLEAVFAGVTDILYGRLPAPLLRPLGFAVSPELLARGPEIVAGRIRELQVTEAGAWDFSERAVNALGYEMMRSGKADVAVAVFRYLVESFPQSGNAWDSLGEGLAALGKKDEAVKAYARSLELDPGNRNAVAMLQRLMSQ